MSAAREGADLWFHLTSPYGRLRSPYRRGSMLSGIISVLRMRHCFHDTIGRRWNRLVACPLLGHRKVQAINEPREPVELHCFKCERRVSVEDQP